MKEVNMKGYIHLKDWIQEENKYYTHQYPDSCLKDSYFYEHGMFLENSRVYDLTKYKLIQFGIICKEKNQYKITIDTALFRDGKSEEFESYNAKMAIAKTGEYQLEIPVECLNCDTSMKYNLRFTRRIKIEGEKPFFIRYAGLKLAKSVAIQADYYGAAAEAKQSVNYKINLKNCTQEPQAVSLFWKRYGNEAITEINIPEILYLEGWQEKEIEVKVPVSERIVPGGYEKQYIQMIPNADGREMEKVTFYTSRKMKHPFVLLTGEEIQKIKQKIKQYDWAKNNYKKCLEEEYNWKAPVITGKTRFLFWTSDGHHARKCAILFALGAGEVYEKKAVQFLKELSDPNKGYLCNPRACNQELVHEGEFFKSMAFAYDFVYNSQYLTEQDHRNIEAVLRKFMNYIHMFAKNGNISNWSLAEIEGALCCAAVLQDRAMMNRFLYGVGGMTDLLSRGVLSDGWWFEASIGYNLLAAGIFSEIAHIMLHFGVDLRYFNVPASYSQKIDSRKILQDGLITENWGGNDKNYRNISMMWDSLMNFYDYRGVIFGLNDSAEMKVQGTSAQLMDSRYDLAYALYKKPEYAELLKRSDLESRDLIFGEGELPNQEKSMRGLISDYADSSGACVLRSQKKGVTNKEQIQAVLKYGSHGGAHGHYDRGSMTSLMRFGRSLTGPENIWYSYHTMMYKFYVQTSINHNMVIVDFKMQEAVAPKRLLFYAGEMIQAAAVENKGVWSNPPYGGWQVNGDRTLKERSWNEGRYLPIPEPEPEYSVRSEFTEPVLTRRLMIVTDDFVINFDYAKGDKLHNFACFYHLHGLRRAENLAGQTMVPNRQTEQLDTSMLGSGQFITECSWYDMEQGAALEFQLEYTETKNNGHQWLCRNRTGYNEIGIMNTRLYAAYPEKATLVIGADPEYQGVNKQLFYNVRADGTLLKSGQFGAWILGRDTIEANIQGVDQLVLETRVNQVEFEENNYVPMEKTIFWGNPRILTKEGKWIDLSELDYETENIDKGYGVGKDYAGEAVKIQAKEYKKAIPAEPQEYDKVGKIIVNLKGLNAVQFCSDIGGDYPVGDETERRRSIAVCQNKKEASWITVLETTQREYQIKNVKAQSAGEVTVFMMDGREIVIRVKGMEEGELFAAIEEWKDGTLIRQESTTKNQ